MADILVYILLLCMILCFGFHALNEIKLLLRSVKTYYSDKKFEETYPSIEEENNEFDKYVQRYNVEEFRTRMKNLKTDENGLYDDGDVPITNEESGAEIITDNYETEFERTFI